MTMRKKSSETILCQGKNVELAFSPVPTMFLPCQKRICMIQAI